MTRIPRDLIKHLEWTPESGAPPVHASPAAPLPVVSGGIVHDTDGYVFEQLAIAPGLYHDVVFKNSLLSKGAEKTQTDHWAAVQKSKSGVVLPNGQVLYAMMHRAYASRDDASLAGVIDPFRAWLKADWETKYKHSGTRIDYVSGSLEATIQHLQFDGSVIPVSVAIPEFTRATNDWSYLVLAPEQPESALGTCEALPENARPFLEGLLGEHYEDAAAVFQYLSSRHNGNLREVRVWTPTMTNRDTARALVLGLNNVRFYINANSNIGINGPARGVAVRAKNSP